MSVLKLSDDCQSFFVPENLKSTKTLNLFDNQYTLIIETYSTRQSCWDYTRGIIKDNNDNVLFDIQRNCADFMHIEFTTANNIFMIVGSSYIQPNLLNLTSRKILSVENDNYCWASAKVSKSNETLIVMGCYWAHPYEHRFYDLICLSNPDCDIMPMIKCDKDICLEVIGEFDKSDYI